MVTTGTAGLVPGTQSINSGLNVVQNH